MKMQARSKLHGYALEDKFKTLIGPFYPLEQILFS